MFKSFFTISFFISISRILGFVRDILIARFLGVSMLSDVFFAAFRLPNFFRRIFAEGAFNSAFVPLFIEKIAQDKSTKDSGHNIKQSEFFVKNIFAILLYSLLIFVIILQIFMPWVMKLLFPGFFNDEVKSSLLISFSHITIFYLIFISLVSLCSGILNSLNKYALPASSPIILNLTLIIMMVFYGKMFPNYGYALAYGVLMAGVLQFLVIFIGVYKKGYLLYPQMPVFNNDIRQFFRKLIPAIIGANVMQINLLIDSIFASMMIGAMSYLYYADRINQLPLAMIGIAIGIALLPNLTRRIKDGNNDVAIKMHNMAVEAGLILVFPATLALTVLAYPIIAALFKGGAFGENECLLVARALMYYSFGLPSYVLVKVMEPGFFSRQDTKTPMKIAMICLISNLLLNCVFYLFAMGFVGIILSSVISSYLNLSLLIHNLIRKKHFYFTADFKHKILAIIWPSILMAVVLFLIKALFLHSHYFHEIIELLIMIIVGLVTYFIASLFSGSLKILTDVLKMKRKRNDNIEL